MHKPLIWWKLQSVAALKQHKTSYKACCLHFRCCFSLHYNIQGVFNTQKIALARLYHRGALVSIYSKCGQLCCESEIL